MQFAGGISIGAINVVELTLCENGHYKNTAQSILDNFQLEDVIQKKFSFGLFRTIFDADYTERALSKAFSVVEKNNSHIATFADIQKAKLLMTSFNLDSGQETIWTNYCDKFKNLGLQRYVAHIDKISLVDATMASAASQTAFPAKKIKYHIANEECDSLCSKQTCAGKDVAYSKIDGGNVRNTPVLK